METKVKKSEAKLIVSYLNGARLMKYDLFTAVNRVYELKYHLLNFGF